MAVGEFAQPIYDLIDERGGEKSLHALNEILDHMIRWMHGKDIEDFVADFRRVYECEEEPELWREGHEQLVAQCPSCLLDTGKGHHTCRCED